MVSINLPKITKREHEILQLIAKGFTSPKIANLLKIANDTVENHKRNLREKTGTKTSAELIGFIYEHNLL
jgi:DNA-binding CsgD family transcriptional regulator